MNTKERLKRAWKKLIFGIRHPDYHHLKITNSHISYADYITLMWFSV